MELGFGIGLVLLGVLWFSVIWVRSPKGGSFGGGLGGAVAIGCGEDRLVQLAGDSTVFLTNTSDFLRIRLSFDMLYDLSDVSSMYIFEDMAAVDACIKPKFPRDCDDENDGPMIFKRTKTTSKQTQLNSEIKSITSPKQGGSSQRNASGTPSPSGQKTQKSMPQKVVAGSSAKPSGISNTKSPPIGNEKSKQLMGGSSKISDVEKKPLSKPPVKPEVDSEDSDDDKPLSIRLSTASSKSNLSPAPKGLKSPPPSSSASERPKVSVKKSSEDSEDEIPLSSKFRVKSEPSSVKKSFDSDEEKPLASRFQQNGSSKNNEAMKPKVLSKRPLSSANSSDQSSLKKPKLSDGSVAAKVKQVSVKSEPKVEDDDHVPIGQRMKKPAASDNKLQSTKKTTTKIISSSVKKVDKKSKKIVKNSKYSKSTKLPPGSGEGQKWTTLEHNGVIFPPPYKSHGVKMLYNGQAVDLTPEQEEVATMFAVMKDTDYATKPKFIENFMDYDSKKERGPLWGYNKFSSLMQEKKAVKEDKLKQEEKYMWAVVDGVKEKVGNFRVEPPGLFRGRGEHPKMGKLKRRIFPSDITINIGEGAPVPKCPIPGESWKEVKHDNTVTWLAFWNDPINPKEFKYVFLAASSSLKGQSDKEKYEKARLLKDYIHNIRANYTKDFTNKDVMKRQIAVATYLIDKLALRAGNEKDDDEADTVGCCTLKVENVSLIPPNKLQFDFLGKDSIRYFNTVDVELPVYKAIGQFRSGKKDGDDLFDKLDTSKLNAHLKELMPGLTAKVFRTYNASITLDDMLNRETKGGDVAEKIVVYQHANKEVAIICNHQRSVSKSHDAQMSRLNEKMDELKALLDELKTDLARAKKGKPPLKGADGKPKKNLNPESLERKISQTTAKIEKMERDMKTKEDLKTVALGTSKINYLDPRISVAWCKRHEVPIEKVNIDQASIFSSTFDVLEESCLPYNLYLKLQRSAFLLLIHIWAVYSCLHCEAWKFKLHVELGWNGSADHLIFTTFEATPNIGYHCNSVLLDDVSPSSDMLIVILSEACGGHQRTNNGCKDCVSEQMKYSCPFCVPILRCAARCLWSGSSQAKCVKKCDCGGGKQPRLLDCKKCMVRICKNLVLAMLKSLYLFDEMLV
ncbi:hypothetical protein Syun_026866 [Stephania yunnanensis]|uniref:DNA topoisomerase I n=1 Tax=Stephania yunnanensis TaxID=152371 RepID=A0AAP0EGT8_9MAGN